MKCCILPRALCVARAPATGHAGTRSMQIVRVRPSVSLALLACWALASGCGNPPDSSGGVARNDAAALDGGDASNTADASEAAVDVPSDAPPPRCTTDRDCAADAMGNRACDVATGQCVPCVPGAQRYCAQGQYCTPMLRCESGCAADLDCTPMDGGTIRCDTSRHVCVGCVTDDHCPPGALCQSGTCEAGCNDAHGCPRGDTCCRGACQHTQTDGTNCGACGVSCAAVNASSACVMGACTVAGCVAGRGDCDRSYANGCEVDLGNNAAHCGMCGRACAPTESCVEGSCAPIVPRIRTVAGGGFCDGGPAVAASLDHPSSIAVMADGSILFTSFNAVRRLAVDGTITTIAGSAVPGYSGDGGLAVGARLHIPQGIALGVDGRTIYVADRCRIRRITPGGVIDTVAGSGACAPDPRNDVYVPRPALSVGISPGGLTVASDGTIYFTEGTQRVWRLNTDGTVVAVAGSGVRGTMDGPAQSAQFFGPAGITIDPRDGSLLVVEYVNSSLRRISAGVVSTVATGFSGPAGIVVTRSQEILVGNGFANQVVRVDRATGALTPVAGTGMRAYDGDGGPALRAGVPTPWGMALDGAGRVVVATTMYDDPVTLQQFYLRRFTPGGTIETIAGNGLLHTCGDGRDALSGMLDHPRALARHPDGRLYFTEGGAMRDDGYFTGGNVIRMLLPDRTLSTLAGSGLPGFADGPSTTARFSTPTGLAFDAADTPTVLYVADQGNHRIRSVRLTTGAVSTIAGTGAEGFGGDDGMALAARLSQPTAVAVTAAGVLYVADAGNFRVRTITAGVITTVAGNGTNAFSGDGGPATRASLGAVAGIAVSADGRTLYIADTTNHRVRRVDLSLPTPQITTIAGDGSSTWPGDGAQATRAGFDQPVAVRPLADGSLLIVDRGLNAVRRVLPDGTARTLAGVGARGFEGDSGPAASARLDFPCDIIPGAGSGFLIADTGNDRVREIFYR